MPKSNNRPYTSITDQAIHWFVRLHSGDCTEAEREQCAEWLAGDNSHQREYERVAAMWTEMDELKTVPWKADTPSCIRPGHRTGHPHQQEYGAATPEKKLTLISARPRIALALAAVFMVALAGTWLWNQPVRYATAKGERKTITLSDGSAITLNTDTAVSVQVLPWKRTVRMEHGEALFTVTPNAHRPFIVTAGVGAIQVFGTIFNVYKKPDQVVVTVLEGIVQITTEAVQRMIFQRSLSFGQQLSYAATGVLLQEQRVDAQAVAAWREGRLVFDALPLAEVIRELARSRAGEIRLADSMLNDVKVSGVFKSDDFDGLLRAIAQMLQVSIQQVSEDVIVLAPAKPPPNSPTDTSPYFRVKPLP